MIFLYPQIFIFLLLLLWMFQKRKRGTFVSKICQDSEVAKDKFWMLYLITLLMVVALARPVLVDEERTEEVFGKEFVIALDVSYSMQATDLVPSRLQYAKDRIEKLLLENPHDSFALFAFTTNPLILSPSTSDHQLLKAALDALEVKNILTQGTNLEKLLIEVAKLPMEVKNLLLFSDGGDVTDISSLVNICQIHDIKVFVSGMATNQGSTLRNKYGKNRRDQNGNLVISRLNPMLKSLALQSGGAYFQHDEDFLLTTIDQKQLHQKEKVGYLELFWFPLLVALVLFLFYSVKFPKRFLVWIPFFALHVEAGILDWYYLDQATAFYEKASYQEAAQSFEKITSKSIQSQMNLANSYYQAGSYKKAQTIYSSLMTKEDGLKKKLLYKLGNCAVKLKAYDKAKRYYRQALAFGEDKDILYNLKHIVLLTTKKRGDFPAFKSSDHAQQNRPEGQDKQHKRKEGGKMQTQAAASASTGGQKSDVKSTQKTTQLTPKHVHRPLGYKAYELINQGYINEKNPW
ncbi:MAG: VWA domain-containing protein [Epsilonproteobacteria bacterium]|nr:VWA domain-containing protein [Campylobacterota bacterium]